MNAESGEKADPNMSIEQQNSPTGGVAKISTSQDEVKNLLNVDSSVIQKAQDDHNSEAEDEDEDDANAIDQALKIEAEDIHLSSKVVLQRQFFEAIARSASVKFANRSDLPTLSSKLEVLFKNLLIPNAGKSKAKTADEEVSHL